MINSLKSIVNKFLPLITGAKRYIVVIFLVSLCVVYGFLAYQINSLTQAEPTPEAVAEKLETVARPRIDQDAVDKMQQLEEENIEVRTLFQEARSNPFSE